MSSEKELPKDQKSSKASIPETIINNIIIEKHCFSELKAIREDRMEAKIISTISVCLPTVSFS